jgi:regulator of cell morphogenesis and NO signaling
MMLAEHDGVGEILLSLRKITGGYTPPDDACTTYRATYAELEALENDLHLHIHLENNVLFPRVLAGQPKE